MIEDEQTGLELAELTVAQVGRIEPTRDLWMPYRMLDPAGVPVEPVSEFFRDLQAAGRSQATLLWHGPDSVPFPVGDRRRMDRATRVEARDFCRWMLVAGKPFHGRSGAARERSSTRCLAAGVAGQLPG